MKALDLSERGGRHFRDRRDGGRALADAVAAKGAGPNSVVLGLPRGGVPVGYEVAVHLGVPLDAFAVRKLGVPGHEELAMGAVASGGLSLINEDVVAWVGASREEVLEVAQRELAELARREKAYRDHRIHPVVEGRTVILVDDGLATGATMLVAIAAVHLMKPARVVVAVPVASREALAAAGRDADDVICCETPEPFYGVGAWYDDFGQTSDDEVRALLNDAAKRPGFG